MHILYSETMNLQSKHKGKGNMACSFAHAE